MQKVVLQPLRPPSEWPLFSYQNFRSGVDITSKEHIGIELSTPECCAVLGLWHGMTAGLVCCGIPTNRSKQPPEKLILMQRLN